LADQVGAPGVGIRDRQAAEAASAGADVDDAEIGDRGHEQLGNPAELVSKASALDRSDESRSCSRMARSWMPSSCSRARPVARSSTGSVTSIASTATAQTSPVAPRRGWH